MPIDAGLYGQYAQRPVNPLDIRNQLMQSDENRLLLQQKQALVADQARQQQEAGVIRNALMTAKPDMESRANALEATGLQSGYTMADQLRKNAQAQQKSAADIAGTQATTAKTQQEVGIKNLTTVREQILPLVQNPQQMAMLISKLYDDPATGPHISALGSKEDALRSIPTDPKQFPDYVAKFGLGMEKYTADQTQKRGQDMSRQTSLDTTKMHTAATLQAANISAATSRANNQATIAKDYKVAGLDAQGNFTGGTGTGGVMDGIIDGIGQGKIPESTALSRIPPGMKNQVMSEVMKRYPDYDPTAIQTRQAASKAFATGSQGNSMRSFAVAGQHLDQLNTLVDALGNGNMQIINKVANQIGEQTGNPAPTNFDAAKDVVSKEVVKAIVAGGGGVAEREELSNLMSKAKSPAQLKGVISQYRSLMGAQHDALLQQRRAAGLPDSTLPNYAKDEAPSSPSLSLDQDAIAKELARRGGR